MKVKPVIVLTIALGVILPTTIYFLKQYFSKKKWSNAKNKLFYEKVLSENALESFCKKAALDNLCDYKTAMTHISKENKNISSSKILEVGAGYGRIIQALKNDGYKDIVAIEQIKISSQILKTKYNGYADILNINLRKLNLNQRFNIIFWLWCGISDFSRDEQLDMLTILLKHLSYNGVIVIDTPIDSNANQISKQEHRLNSKYGTYIGYVPSNKELETYATQLKLNIKHVFFKTKTNRKRCLHFLKRNPQTSSNKF